MKAADLRDFLSRLNDGLTGSTANVTGFTLVSEAEKQAMSALDDAIHKGMTYLRAEQHAKGLPA